MSEEKLVSIRVFMPDDLRAKFKAQCALESRTMNDVVVSLVEEWIQQQKPSNPDGK